MTRDKKEPVALECEEWFYLSLTQVSSSFGISSDKVLEIIEEGIISVEKDEKNQWRFDNEALRHIRTVLRLNHDLGVNLAGAGLALELLKEIEHLRAMLNKPK
ncbi:MAG: MerR family transcriptional regulator [Tatlockia sp.]|nr:MerR family transcriptional regulator [Tatlockia sp.]